MMTEPDELLFRSFSRVNRAHVVMMCEQNILTATDGAALLRALTELDGLGFTGLSQDFRKGELLTHVEQYVMDHAGMNVGGNLHIGRSRGDIYPATYRLYVREPAMVKLIPLVKALPRAVADALCSLTGMDRSLKGPSSKKP